MLINPTHIWQIVAVGILLGSTLAFGQVSVFATPAPTPPSALSEVDTLVKIVAAVITGLATLIGLPIVFLTYRKTRAEITKLELEANALREKQSTQSTSERDDEGSIRIAIDNSPYANIKVLADPRFLVPLLILLDFIFAWIVLTLAGHLLSIFSLGILGAFLLALLSASLFLPIARQVIRVHTVLRPLRTPEEVRDSMRQTRMAAYMMYGIVVAISLIFGVLMLTAFEALIDLGRYLAWALIVCDLLLIVASPLIKRRFDGYLARIQERSFDEQKPEV